MSLISIPEFIIDTLAATESALKPTANIAAPLDIQYMRQFAHHRSIMSMSTSQSSEIRAATGVTMVT